MSEGPYRFVGPRGGIKSGQTDFSKSYQNHSSFKINMGELIHNVSEYLWRAKLKKITSSWLKSSASTVLHVINLRLTYLSRAVLGHPR